MFDSLHKQERMWASPRREEVAALSDELAASATSSGRSCSSCMHALSDGDTSCGRCGTPCTPCAQDATAATCGSSSKGWTCANCDAAQPERNKFCGGCGATRDGGGGEEQCVVCMDAPRDTLLKHAGDVGHTCVCKACAELLKAGGDVCPMCREPILEFIRAF
jgi:hypothetical protein